MEVRLVGTGGSGGWPQADCGCASCERARSSGRHRAPARVVVDGVLGIDSSGPPARLPGPRRGPEAGGAGGNGYRVERVPGGWDVTGPDGGRLLVGEERGVAAPPDGSPPYDVVLLDVTGDPAQLGALRYRGLVHAGTIVAVLHADHRVTSEEELGRRCRYFSVTRAHDGDVLTTTAGPAARGTTAPDAGQPRRVLVLGGARSGKSRHAELRLAAEPRVTYLAAGPYPAGAQPAGDADWAQRVAGHQARRPPWWQTVESTDAAGVLRSGSGAVLFDGAGTWLAAVLDEAGAWPGDDGAAPGPSSRLAGAQEQIAARVDELVAAWRQTPARVVAVSDEVGSGVHPPTRAGRLFRDQLGWLNQRLAAEADEAVLMAAGRALTLPS